MELNIDEALRYLGAGRQAPPELRREAEDTARRLTARLRPRYTYRVFSLERKDGVLRLQEAALALPGKDAQTMLADCGRVVLLGCTLGVEFESMLRAEQARDMAKAVLLDACGSAWVEAGCDEAEREIAARFPGQYLTDRFSPGYGDLPLSLQPAICGALDLGRRLGVHVSERCLMNPSKSVTALIGISDRPQMARIRGCAYCAMRETCTLRKGGTHCGN